MLGEDYLEARKLPEAEQAIRCALELIPGEAHSQVSLGVVCIYQGRWDEAVQLLGHALTRLPKDYVSFNNFGFALRKQGGRDELAIRALEESLRIRPDYAQAHYNLAEALQANGRPALAVAHYERAGVTALKPWPKAALRLAWLLATCPDESVRDGRRALEAAQQAFVQTGGEIPAAALECFAAAAAESGLWSEATDAVRIALASYERQGTGEPTLEAATRCREAQALYETRQPLRSSQIVPAE